MEQPPPLHRDLVVWPRAASNLYPVSSYPDEPFAAFTTSADAVYMAQGLARTARLDVWTTDDGVSFRPLAAHRPTVP